MHFGPPSPPPAPLDEVVDGLMTGWASGPHGPERQPSSTLASQPTRTSPARVRLTARIRVTCLGAPRKQGTQPSWPRPLESDDRAGHMQAADVSAVCAQCVMGFEAAAVAWYILHAKLFPVGTGLALYVGIFAKSMHAVLHAAASA